MADNIVARQASVPQTAIFTEAAKAAQKVAAYARTHAHEDQRTSLMTQTDSYRKKILEHLGWKFMRWPCRTYRFGADKVDIKVCHQYREYSDRSPQSEGTGVGVYFEEQNKCALDKKGGTSPRMCPGHAQAFCRRQGVHALRSGGGTLAIIAENGKLDPIKESIDHLLDSCDVTTILNSILERTSDLENSINSIGFDVDDVKDSVDNINTSIDSMSTELSSISSEVSSASQAAEDAKSAVESLETTISLHS